MFQPLELFVGLRYVRSRRRRGIVSFMSGASLVGVALGVAALIVILSVMNGLETELRNRLLSMTAHLSVRAEGGLPDWRGLAERLAERSGVDSVSPYVELQAMLAAGGNLEPAIVRGILPEQEGVIVDHVRMLDDGGLERLRPGGNGLVLGRTLAGRLGVSVGDSLNVLVPHFDERGLPAPRLAGFVVAGIFDAGVPDHNSGLALAHLVDASRLDGLRGRAEGVAVRLDDALLVGPFRRANADLLAAPDLVVSDWTEEHASYFTAIRIEKTMMSIILMFIVAVAAFNIVASLMMVVTEKQRDVAILRTSGLEPARVARIFFVQGAVIGLAGTLIGTALGLALAFNVDVIVPWLERTFGFQIFPGDVYYVTEVPSEVHALDVTLIPIVAFVLTVLATIYPARRAAAIAPADALRYE